MLEEASGSSKLWHADLPFIMEKIWGPGQVLPSSIAMMNLLVAPFGLNKEMSILDLSAGLGGMARKLAVEFHTYVTGLETDPMLAQRGMAISNEQGKSKQASIKAYNPAEFVSSRHYDCIVACELFYRVPGKEKFFKAIAAALKSRGQIAFTDYILDPAPTQDAAVRSWLEREAVTPMSMKDMTKAWARLGFDVRVSEDQTAVYRRDLVQGMAEFAGFLADNPPDEMTKPLILQEMGRWALREAALGHGLKLCRFYAIKY